MNFLKKPLLIISSFFVISSLSAQEPDSVSQNFVKGLKTNDANYKETVQQFNNYWKGKTPGKGKGYKAFKRWEYEMRSKVDQNGNFIDRSAAFVEWKKYNRYAYSGITTNKSVKPTTQMVPGNWIQSGPTSGVPSGGGAGRILFIRFMPGTPTTLFVGTPGGGVWKSTNSGGAWTNISPEIPVLGCSDLAIDPSNTNIMYLATGDKDAGDTYSVGVLKSTDGGLTWNPTGLSYTSMQSIKTSCLLINPLNTSELWCGTSQGIKHTLNGGVSWVSAGSTSVYELEYRPGSKTVIYGCGTSFTRSLDGGNNFKTTGITGVPAGSNRLAMAVTAADSNYVYLVASKATDNSFNGISKSTDGGLTFTTKATTPNAFGWNTNGGDAGGQGWYDIAIAASPTNRDYIVFGGVNTWKSTNGGTSISLNTHWTGSGGKPYVHADCHVIKFQPGSGTNYYIGCDGGVFKTTNTGTAFTDASQTLYIAQIYKLGVSQMNATQTMTGWQDNGSQLHTATNASQVLGGDGMECAIHPSNANIMYGELYYGDINRSTNGGGSFSNVVSTGGSGVDGDGDWVTPFNLNPANGNEMIVGKIGIYRSMNGSTGWTQLSAPAGGTYKNMAYSANGQYIYATTGSSFVVSTDNGTTFNDLSGNLPSGSQGVSYINVCSNNPDWVWFCSPSFSAGQKTYFSKDHGLTWTNISNGLPNVPCNTIVCEPNSPNRVYVGTDIGVFVKDSTMSNWINFSYGLPNVEVKELEIQVSGKKLRAATYGRGLWETDLYVSPTNKPVAQFAANKTSVCMNESIDMSDLSSNLPSTWSWTFQGGTPSTSTLQFPQVKYATGGDYPVKLMVTNAAGTDSTETIAYIHVNALPNINAGNDISICKGDTVQLQATGGVSYQWTPNVLLTYYNISNPRCTTSVTRTYTVTASDALGCINTDAITITVNTTTTPTIATNNSNLVVANTSSANTYQWYLNGTLLVGVTNDTLLNAQQGSYMVYATNITTGCTTKSASFLITGIDGQGNLGNVNIYPVPNNGIFSIELSSNLLLEKEMQVMVVNMLGKTIFNKKLPIQQLTEIDLTGLNLSDGTYELKIKLENQLLKQSLIIQPSKK